MAKKKPDQVADNPNILPYASNVGAPVIKPTDLTSFKHEKILKTNFEIVANFKPFSSRKDSSEKFVVAKGFRV